MTMDGEILKSQTILKRYIVVTFNITATAGALNLRWEKTTYHLCCVSAKIRF